MHKNSSANSQISRKKESRKKDSDQNSQRRKTGNTYPQRKTTNYPGKPGRDRNNSSTSQATSGYKGKSKKSNGRKQGGHMGRSKTPYGQKKEGYTSRPRTSSSQKQGSHKNRSSAPYSQKQEGYKSGPKTLYGQRQGNNIGRSSISQGSDRGSYHDGSRSERDNEWEDNSVISKPGIDDGTEVYPEHPMEYQGEQGHARKRSKIFHSNIRSFHDLELDKYLLRALDDINFIKPTDVQQRTIPLALQGEDLMVQSMTGTGKTAAFGLPILNHLDTGKHHIQALILAPTRELCLQIAREMERYNTYSKIHIVPIYGGQKIETQFSLLKKRADIVVSTPGRLIDHLRRKTISLSKVSTVVLDEADRMLDMGFIEDIIYILNHTPKNRQTMLFTATLLGEVQLLARDFMNNPTKLILSKDELVVSDIKETFYRVGRRNKLWALMQIIALERPVQGIIFCETKRMVDIVAERLHKLRIKATALHGDLRQHKRERIMNDFRSGDITFLVATDVAARGLDIPAVSHVFNYDVPENKEQYVHRVGRTGRIGAKGRAITFVSKENFHAIKEIERFLKRTVEYETIPEIRPDQNHMNVGGHGSKPGKGMKIGEDLDDGEMGSGRPQDGQINTKGKDGSDILMNPLRKVYDFDDMADHFGMVALRLDVGEKNGISKFELLEYLTEGNSHREMDVGDIEVSSDETLVHIKKHAVMNYMKHIQRKPYKGIRIHYDFVKPM